jgi:hypothetical protein
MKKKAAPKSKLAKAKQEIKRLRQRLRDLQGQG